MFLKIEIYHYVIKSIREIQHNTDTLVSFICWNMGHAITCTWHTILSVRGSFLIVDGSKSPKYAYKSLSHVYTAFFFLRGVTSYQQLFDDFPSFKSGGIPQACTLVEPPTFHELVGRLLTREMCLVAIEIQTHKNLARCKTFQTFAINNRQQAPKIINKIEHFFVSK